MQNIFETLYNSNIDLSDGAYNGPDSDFIKATKKRRETVKKLMDLLDDTGKELFEEFCAATDDMEEIRRYNTFVNALRFGTLFMAEVLTDEDERSSNFHCEN